jgi:hypothetical protein
VEAAVDLAGSAGDGHPSLPGRPPYRKPRPAGPLGETGWLCRGTEQDQEGHRLRVGRSEKDAEAAGAGRATRRGGGRTPAQYNRGGTTHHDDGGTCTRHRADAASSHHSPPHRTRRPGTRRCHRGFGVLPQLTCGCYRGLSAPRQLFSARRPVTSLPVEFDATYLPCAGGAAAPQPRRTRAATVPQAALGTLSLSALSPQIGRRPCPRTALSVAGVFHWRGHAANTLVAVPRQLLKRNSTTSPSRMT